MKRRVAGHGRRFSNDLYHHKAVLTGLAEHDMGDDSDDHEPVVKGELLYLPVRKNDQVHAAIPRDDTYSKDQDEEKDEGFFSSFTSWLADPDAWTNECLSLPPIEDRRYHPLDPNEEYDEGPIAIAVAFAV